MLIQQVTPDFLTDAKTYLGVISLLVGALVYAIIWLSKRLTKAEEKLDVERAAHQVVIDRKDGEYRDLADKVLVVVNKVEDKLPILADTKDITKDTNSKVITIEKLIADLKQDIANISK